MDKTQVNEPLLASSSAQTEQTATYQNDYSWVKFALLTALCIGFVNFLLGDLSAKLGVAGSFPIFYGIVVMGVVYHVVVKDSLAVYFTPTPIEGLDTQARDNNDAFQQASDDDSTRKFNWHAFWGVVIRGLNHMLLICMTFVSFKYAALAEINQGVIASLFTSGVIFTSILFYFIYQESLTSKDVIGIAFILSGVALIGFGKEQASSGDAQGGELIERSTEKSQLDKQTLLWLSILFAILCGLSFALNSFVMKHYVRKFNFDVIQLNLDGYLICAVLLATGYFIKGPSAYSVADVMKAAAASVLSLIGTASMTQAFKTGKGGPIQAIDSLKVLVPLLMNIWLRGQVPSWMQGAGMICSIFGALVISFKTKEQVDEVKIEKLSQKSVDYEEK